MTHKNTYYCAQDDKFLIVKKKTRRLSFHCPIR